MSSLTAIPVPRRYVSISSGVRRNGSEMPDNVLIYERHKINPRAGYFHQGAAMLVILCVEGRGTVCVDDVLLDISPGKMVVVFPWQLHCYINLEMPRRWVVVRAEWEPPKNVYCLRNQLLHSNDFDIELFDRMTRIWNECGDAPAIWKGDYLCAMCATLICGLVERCRGAIACVPVPAEKYDVLEKVNRYIHQHLGQPFNIAMLAEALGYTPNYLGAAFKARFFITLEEYIKQLRIDKAKNMLVGTSLSIGEIARKLGYSSLFSFSNRFRQVVGMSPKKYRRKTVVQEMND